MVKRAEMHARLLHMHHVLMRWPHGSLTVLSPLVRRLGLGVPG